MQTIVLFVVGFFSMAAVAGGSQHNDSKYTSVRFEDCVTIDSSEFDEPFQSDYYDGICKGQGPYAVEISGADNHYSLNLLYRGIEINGLTKTAAAHQLGSDFIEWRYRLNKFGKEDLKAIIFRIEAYELYEVVDLLHVVKLDKEQTCTVAVLRNEANSNQKARDIADNIDTYSCLQ